MRPPPKSTLSSSSAASDVYKRQVEKYERESRLLAGMNVRNRGSVGYNLVSGQAINSVEENRAKHREAMLAHSVRTRTRILDAKANSTTYNVITGEDRPRVAVPAKPSPLYLSLIHISEPTRLLSISYAVFCLKKKNIKKTQTTRTNKIGQ
eukprot:TRINITY_DN46887_c0_g1_i1.p1 TRINITY_DN46887_c0_g1~~TRINITY_DN46887_c0_g1_i1.p1  ORF type:complete len:151 (+),score=29.16 TRINITY_DN46887_c0_g1_i1:116-568(+)